MTKIRDLLGDEPERPPQRDPSLVRYRPCITPEKDRFTTREHAVAEAARRTHYARFSAYRCACGYWHLTRHEVDPPPTDDAPDDAPIIEPIQPPNVHEPGFRRLSEKDKRALARRYDWRT